MKRAVMTALVVTLLSGTSALAQEGPLARAVREAQSQNQRTPPDRIISQDDLNRMLRQMEEAMRRGDMAEAQRLLDQLRNILENLQTAQPNNRMTDPLGREMNQAMQDLEDMAREQQNLRDETFRDGQNRRMQQGDRPRQGQRQQGQRQQPQEDRGDPGFRETAHLLKHDKIPAWRRKAADDREGAL